MPGQEVTQKGWVPFGGEDPMAALREWEARERKATSAWVRDPNEHPLNFISAYKESKGIKELKLDMKIISDFDKNRKEGVEGMLKHLMVADEQKNPIKMHTVILLLLSQGLITMTGVLKIEEYVRKNAVFITQMEKD